MKLEDYTIHFTWGDFHHQGEMTIVLHPFLLGGGRSISKVKQLIKYIRTSNNPEVIEQIQQFIEQFNEEFTDTKKATERMVISLEEKVILAEKMLKADRESRKQVKKCSGKKGDSAWEAALDKLNETVKDREDQFKSLKKELSEQKQVLNRLDKNKAFLQEVQKILG